MPGEDDAGQADRVGALNHIDGQDDSFSFDNTIAGRNERPATHVALVWDWEADLADRERERRVDGDNSFVVDRRVLRDVVKEVMGAEVVQILFISSGTFHKAYLITLADGRALVARVARRFMPRLKTESEVATLAYLRQFTSIPVPQVYHYDSNPYNRLGGEYILMSKANGIPLSRVYHSMDHTQLCSLLKNLAELLVPLFAHRFSHIGSLYFGKGSYGSAVRPPPPPCIASQLEDSSSMPTPTITSARGVEFSFASGLPTPSRTPGLSSSVPPIRQPFLPNNALSNEVPQDIHVGPIISWPFFGSHRGDLTFPEEIDRGPWGSTEAYLQACVEREVNGVKRENEGRARPHRLHLDPDDVAGRKKAQGEGEYVWGFGYVKKTRLESYADGPTGSETPSVERDESEEGEEDSDSDSDDGSASLNSDSDEDVMYRDYRRYQRSTFLVAELSRRAQRVEGEMTRWKRCVKSLEAILSDVMENTGIDAKEATQKGDRKATLDIREDDGWMKKGIGGTRGNDKGGGSSVEEFALDCHDLSLENVFVDENDPSKITCVIDWESTTTRPLWACAHLPSFLLSSPFAANLFRRAVAAIAALSSSSDEPPSTSPSVSHNRTPFVSHKLARFAYPNPNLSKYANTAKAWLALERIGSPLRWAHRCAEWDGWEDGLVGSILGELESDDLDNTYSMFISMEQVPGNNHRWEEPLVTEMRNEFLHGVKLTGLGFLKSPNPSQCGVDWNPETSTASATIASKGLTRIKLLSSETPKNMKGSVHGGPIVEGPGLGVGLGPNLRRASDAERERERMLDQRGDVCGGRGGELGRRLEAWLVETSPEREEGSSSAVSDC